LLLVADRGRVGEKRKQLTTLTPMYMR
jgi:hypothetical protein